MEAQLTAAIIPRPDSVTQPGSGTIELEEPEPAGKASPSRWPEPVQSRLRSLSRACSEAGTKSEPAELSEYKRREHEYGQAVITVRSRGQGDGWRGAADVVKVTPDLRREHRMDRRHMEPGHGLHKAVRSR